MAIWRAGNTRKITTTLPIPEGRQLCPLVEMTSLGCVPQCFSIKLYCRVGFSFMAITWQTLKIPYCSSNVAFIIYTKWRKNYFWCLKIHIYVCFYTHRYTCIVIHVFSVKEEIFWDVREESVLLFVLYNTQISLYHFRNLKKLKGRASTS